MVVVDHNPALGQRLAAQYPDIEVIASKFERGLSGARNTGIDQAKGNVVVFLDDDAYADPCWLQSLLACYDDESVLGAGGLVLPDWSPAGPPGWLPEEFLWVVGCSYRGLPETKAEVRNPVGANMSFRRTAFGTAGYFDSSVGRNAKVTRPMGCEETEFSIRLRQMRPDGRIIYEPRAVVYHHVARFPPDVALLPWPLLCGGLLKGPGSQAFRDVVSIELGAGIRDSRRTAGLLPRVFGAAPHRQQGGARPACRAATRRVLDGGRICRCIGEPCQGSGAGEEAARRR